MFPRQMTTPFEYVKPTHILFENLHLQNQIFWVLLDRFNVVAPEMVIVPKGASQLGK